MIPVRPVAWIIGILLLSCSTGPTATSTTMPAPDASTRAITPTQTPKHAPTQTKRAEGHRSMQIKISETTVPLAKPIPVEITFENATGGVIARDNPEKSLAVEMHAVSLVTKEDMSYTMGKTTTTTFPGNDKFAIVVPTPERIEIAPGAAHVFKSDMNQRLYLHPGEYDVFLSEGSSTSNHVELTIELTRASVEALFALARDENATYGRREWAADFLSQLQPEFKLNLAHPEDSNAQKTKAAAENQIIVARFAAWWDQNKTGPQMDAKLKNVR